MNKIMFLFGKEYYFAILLYKSYTRHAITWLPRWYVVFAGLGLQQRRYTHIHTHKHQHYNNLVLRN